MRFLKNWVRRASRDIADRIDEHLETDFDRQACETWIGCQFKAHQPIACVTGQMWMYQRCAHCGEQIVWDVSLGDWKLDDFTIVEEPI